MLEVPESLDRLRSPAPCLGYAVLRRHSVQARYRCGASNWMPPRVPPGHREGIDYFRSPCNSDERQTEAQRLCKNHQSGHHAECLTGPENQPVRPPRSGTSSA
jgi:hypothetical protein